MVSIPHGGKLVKKVLKGKRREAILSAVNEMPQIVRPSWFLVDAVNIGYGVFSPLEGFMTSDDFHSVLYDMRLSNDLPWTIPIVLDVSGEERSTFSEGDDIILSTNNGLPIAIMAIEEIYRYNKEEFAELVYKTKDLSHPGVARVMNMGEFLVGGEIHVLNEVPNPFERYLLYPEETRVLFRERGWKTIVGFQTRNAPHLGHEYVQKTALTFVDGLFINPLIGKKKKGDFKDEVILKAYDALIKNYYPKNSVVMSILRTEMRYAGPREAIHHAIIRKNFGCTHFIIGRDHAGVGNFYGPYEAQEIFYQFPDLGITPLFFKEFFYCKKCGGIANPKTCPHTKEDRVYFSGTRIRNMILKGEKPPSLMMRPEVADVILSYDNPFIE